ncbi:Activating signal cointegrator 1 complex subunit 2, partial [Linum perenne]
ALVQSPKKEGHLLLLIKIKFTTLDLDSSSFLPAFLNPQPSPPVHLLYLSPTFQMSRRFSSTGGDRHLQDGASSAAATSNNGGQNHQYSNRNYAPKPQKKFVPKQQNTSSPTLSTSLRQSDVPPPPPPSSSSSSRAAGDSTSRIRMADSGEWVSNRVIGGTTTAAGGRFVNYLPQDEAVATGLVAEEGGLDAVESQRVVDLLNRELSRFLKLSPREFWKEVAKDESLHGFLDSFLKFRSRWYDFPYRGAKDIVAGVIVGDLELSRRVFMVLYRISSNRDPGARSADSLSSKDHSVLLQEKKLLDLAKLLDICGIYGHENEELTGILVRNALNSQPGIQNNLTAVMSQFLAIVRTMYQRCISSLEVLLSSTSPQEVRSSQLRDDFLEVMDFINDAIVSMDTLVVTYKPAALFFSLPVQMSDGYDELLVTLARLHDSLIPSFQRGFRMMFSQQGDAGMISNVAVSLKMLSIRIATFGWKILDFCYLSEELVEDMSTIPEVTQMFPAKLEDPMIRAEILVQTFREINGISLSVQETHPYNTFLKNMDQNFHIMGRLDILQNTGWIFLDDENLQYLSGIMMSHPKSSVKDLPLLPQSGQANKVLMDEGTAFLESKISQIKDLFPDYGKGFLAACLEAYNQNPEEVIQRILEGTLHEDLQRLDISLETMPTPKYDQTASRKDKGKGKLDESTSLPIIQSNHSSKQVLVEQTIKAPSGSSSSMVGRFVRKSENLDENILDIKDDKDIARNFALASQYEYDDEYDDSFDDLGLSVAETGLEGNETFSERIRSGTSKTPAAETGSSGRGPSDSKWGSKKKPQYYVKDGKNYSYKVEGSVAVTNKEEAQLITQVHGEQILGLGRGGNIPLGAARKLNEYQEQEGLTNEPEMERRENNSRGFRGRVMRGGGGIGRSRDSQEERAQPSEGSEMEGTGRGRGRGRGRGGADNHHRKDKAIRKHMAGFSG